jgi:cytochrome c biogenesis protein CcmG/thiol:disulfide interchange protein DsbE
MRRVTIPLLLCVLALSACGSADPKSAAPSAAAAKKALAGSPPALAALHDQANELLGGGKDAFEQRLAQLKGHPVVVNKWASWCGPCRAEFPLFQRESVKHGKTIAFVGVDGNDSDADAAKFLKKFPVTYPSYKDQDLKVSQVFNGVQAFPTTAFYDSKGKVAFLHQGQYLDGAALDKDIAQYAK